MQDQGTLPEEFKTRLLATDGEADGDTHTKEGRAARFALRAFGAAAAGGLAYAFLVRPWHLRWGATDDEAASTLPGDELLPQSRLQTTRAITIDAPVADVWPWIVQMGQGRGGLYSYDWLENLVGCDIHSADTIMPDLQHLAVGDTFRLGPEGYPYFTVTSIIPERELVLVAGLDRRDGEDASAPASVAAERFPRSTWAFILRPVDEHRTRLLIRLREDWDDAAGMTFFNRAILEPAHFLMERKMIQGIKKRAEDGAEGSAAPCSGTCDGACRHARPASTVHEPS